MDKEYNFPHIKFGFRGEGILYELNGKEYELNSTWFNGVRVDFDDLRKTVLNKNQKTKIFEEIIQFLNQQDREKPIICFNSDYEDAELWKRLSNEHKSQIKHTEITTIEEQNKSLYKSMAESLRTGRATHQFQNGLKIKSIKYLDKHWDYIKFKKDSEISSSVSVWDKFLTSLNL